MLKSLLALSLAVSMTGAFAQGKGKDKPKVAAGETFMVDTEATKIEWVGKKVTGEHRGFVKVKEGQVNVAGEALTGGNIVVDIDSITCTDLTDPEYNTKFIGHMKSPDFFNTEKYPTSTLMITKSKKNKDGGLEVEGKLTMIGNTQPIKFTASEPKKDGDTYTAKALVTIDRTKWGLKYGSGKFFQGLGDKMIHDEFALNITLVAKKK